MKEGNILAFGACGVNLLRLDQYLGRGSFGSSWAVSDLDTGRRYCLKLVRAAGTDDPVQLAEVAARVRNEASVQIPSAHVVRAVGFQAYSEREFGVLFDLFENARTLQQWLRDGGAAAPWVRRRHLLRQALEGLAAAHTANIVHRDIKPANILVNDRDEVRIMDFGIGKFKYGGPGLSGGLTQPGARMGTLSYMAPELGLDASKADSRCDVYAFGHVVYEVLTGRNVWDERGWHAREGLGFIPFLEYVRAHTHLVDLAALRCDDEPALRQVLAKALAFDVAARYPSGDAMLAGWFGREAAGDGAAEAPARRKASRALFRIVEGGRKGNVIPLDLRDGEATVLGRQQLDRQNKYLSRRHVQVRRFDGRYFISDAGSTNGTVCGGRLLQENEQMELRDGVQVRLAETFLEFAYA